MVTLLKDVKYSDERPFLPAFDDFEKKTNELAEIVIFNKSSKWSYEEEVRMVAHWKSADVKGKANDGSDMYLFAFPPECIQEIVFGSASQETVRKLIRALVTQKYPHVKLFEARLNEKHFDLDIGSFG